LTKALNELAVLKKSHSSITVHENSHPFTECATWADDYKGTYSFQAGWHFIDQPYLDKGGDLSDYSFTPDAYHIVDALTNLTNWLKNSGTAYKSSYYYKEIMQSFPNEADARSVALRLIIHYVGDIHQPLHTVSEVDSTYKSGDRGGNSETLPTKDGVSNLHGVWDSVAYSYTGYPTLPLSSSDWTWYGTESATMAKSYPTSSSELHDGNFNLWAQEGLALAKTTVYPGKLIF